MVSIIIPVFNNEQTIEILANNISTILKEEPHEIVLVDDFSSDNSNHIINNLKLKNSRIIEKRNEENLGQHLTIIEGLKLAKGTKHLIMDADLQDRAELIPLLINKIQEGYETVFIKRVGIYQSVFRMFSSFIFKMILYLITGLHRKAGSFVIIDNETKNKILKANCPYPYITVLISHFANKISYIDAVRNSRTLGKSSYSTTMRFKSAWTAFKCKYYLIRN